MIRIIENIRGFSELIPSKEKVLEVIGNYVDNVEVTNEKFDEKGLYLLETIVGGDNPQEFYVYGYMRKGEYEGIGESSETMIFVYYFENGICKGGNAVAELDGETGEWIDLGHIIKGPKLN